MAKGWVKSLQCKSNALEDVYHPKPFLPKKPLLPLSSSCGGSASQALKDVVLLLPKHPPLPRKPSTSHRPKPPPPPPEPQDKSNPKPRARPKNRHKPKPTSPPSPPCPAPPSHQFPTLAELPEGHSSRGVVEIIFGSSWSPRGAPFPGKIEMLFRVLNPPRTVARFEDYRAAARSRSGGDARCAADGNEMMRFHCASPAASCVGTDAAFYDAGVASCPVTSPGGKVVEGIRTFSRSGGAHESGGGGAGRRAMLVCRVIAGRARPESERVSEGESVWVGNGELLVFDPRAVLPCFLIIYKL